MKVTNYIIGFILMMPLKVRSQSASSDKDIIGSWIFNYEASKKSMKNNLKEHYNKMDITKQNKLKLSYQNRRIIFSSDAGFIQFNSDRQEFRGRWLISDDEKTLIMTYSDGLTYPQKIQLITPSKLVLIPEDRGNRNYLSMNGIITKN